MLQLYSGAHQKWTKQADQDLVEEVRFQTDSGVLHFFKKVIWLQSALTAESFPTSLAPVGSCVHYGMRKHFPCHNNNNNNNIMPAWVTDKHGEWYQIPDIPDGQHQNQPHSCLCVVKLIVVGALSARLCLHLQSLPTWQFWPCGEQFRIYGCAPTLVTFYPWVKFFFFVTL